MHNLSQLHLVLSILQNLKASVHQFLYLIRVFFSQVRSLMVARWIHQNVPPKKTGRTLVTSRRESLHHIKGRPCLTRAVALEEWTKFFEMWSFCFGVLNRHTHELSRCGIEKCGIVRSFCGTMVLMFCTIILSYLLLIWDHAAQSTKERMAGKNSADMCQYFLSPIDTGRND